MLPLLSAWEERDVAQAIRTTVLLAVAVVLPDRPRFDMMVPPNRYQKMEMAICDIAALPWTLVRLTSYGSSQVQAAVRQTTREFERAHRYLEDMGARLAAALDRAEGLDAR